MASLKLDSADLDSDSDSDDWIKEFMKKHSKRDLICKNITKTNGVEVKLVKGKYIPVASVTDPTQSLSVDTVLSMGKLSYVINEEGYLKVEEYPENSEIKSTDDTFTISPKLVENKKDHASYVGKKGALLVSIKVAKA